MATLLDMHDQSEHPLRERHLVGRWQGADLALSDTRVSTEHAFLSWNRGRWYVRDLGSRNGTVVDGEALTVGDRREIRQGSTLGFGSDEARWRLSDDRAPEPFAVCSDGRVVRAVDGVLLLPDEELPTVALLPDREHTWVLDLGSEVHAAFDREIVRILPDAWRIHLPMSPNAQPETTRRDLHLDQIELVFRVSRDQETIHVEAHHPRQVLDLGVRVHHELLLDLGRARLADPDSIETEAGWVYQDVLERHLRWPTEKIYLTSHRARRQLGQLGVADAHLLVERRSRTAQMRLGVRRVRIEDAE